MSLSSTPLPEAIASILSTSDKRTVVLTCGISGSGKSSLAQTITTQYPNFIRLSIDKYVYEEHGVFGKDYGEERYEHLQEEASVWLRKELEKLLKEGKRSVVLDLSLWNKKDREEWRSCIERWGGARYQVVLVVFKAPESVLWERIQARERRWVEEGMGEGRPVGKELFAMFVRGFEWPEDEGEIVVHIV